MCRLGTIQIQNRQLANLSAKALDGAIKYSRKLPLDCQDPAREAARFAPRFNPELSGSKFQNVLIRRQDKWLFAIFQGSRFVALGQERRNGGLQGTSIR